MSESAEFPEGAYDKLITSELEQRLAGSLLEYETSKIDKSLLPETLARHVHDQLVVHLRGLKEDEQIATANGLMTSLGLSEGMVSAEPHRLLSMRAPVGPGASRRYGDVPVLPLSEVALLTNTGHEPNFGHEIRGEIASSDDVQLICAFIKWHGVRTLEDQLAQLKARGARFRVITSTYLGSTERKALDRLINDFGAEVRISYEIERTRLHAKAWLFHRNTAFHTAYVGSSNLTKVALLDGVEWNVRLTKAVTPSLLRKFDATFETYWNSPNFEPYNPAADAERLDRALTEAGGGSLDRATISLSGLEVRPYPHQREILEVLQAAREVHGHHRNLVVAATGTGKTVVAALDYRNLCAGGDRPSLLFVAHRKEILEQALRTYREVLNDPNFGELYVAGHKPDEWRHVFASIQSLNARDISAIPSDAFDVVVIDEFHHASARSYQQILTRLSPIELLGLTATPERTDGLDVRSYFDGRTAAEIRLWDALDAELLVPFHYFGIADSTDLRQVSWRNGRYDPSELDELYTANTARLRIVLKQLEEKVSEPLQMRALGFCSGVRHAEFMATSFNDAGIPAAYVTGATPLEERARILADLVAKRINIVFSADVFNEGVDLPDVDTVLFLRPTESATIFLQQLGRGLRRTREKAVLTVLDFVGNHRREYRFDARLTAMTGVPRGALRRHIEHEFPELPSGTQLILDRQTQAQVLESLRNKISSRWTSMVSGLRAMGDVSLRTFLEDADVHLSDVLKSGRSWTMLRREAGLPTEDGGPHEAALFKRIPSFGHVDDEDRFLAYQDVLTGTQTYTQMSEIQQRWARMALFSLWPGLPFEDYETPLRLVRQERAVVAEILTVMRLSTAQARHVPERLDGDLRWSPLRSHARYTREELAAALDYATLERKPSNLREGVFYSSEHATDALLITVQKDEAHFSPTTMYNDYAISADLFHWESQSRTTVASPTGQRYLHHRQNGTNVLLFVRQKGTFELGKGAPYTLLGTADYVSHEGEKPIAITWQLRRPMPQDQLTMAAVTAT